MNRRIRKILPLIALAVFVAGCPSSTYHSAVIAEHDFKLAVQSFQQAEMVEFQSGRISQAEHQQLEGGIEKVARAGQTLTTSLQAGAANTTVQQNFATVSTALTDLLNSGVLGIKNENSQNILKAVIQTASAILQNVSQLLALPTTTTTASFWLGKCVENGPMPADRGCTNNCFLPDNGMCTVTIPLPTGGK